MSLERNADILDATKLVFGFDLDGFEAATDEDLAAANVPMPDNEAVFYGVSTREFSAPDPSSGETITATEYFASGQDTAVEEEPVGMHGVLLQWGDALPEFAIDMDSGIVWGGNEETVPLDLEADVAARQRIITALATIANNKLGFV